ncbi:MAG: VWA domain-containing protein [Planctomycetaceae bacterium]
MTFLNATLLFGSLAAAVPVILHLLNRSRFRRIEWGAMHLLEAVIKVNHKRFQFEQWLLLLVRCAIPVLLAMCLARPVLTGNSLLAGTSPVSLVILLDNSYSMDATAAGVSRFEQAVAAAVAIVRNTTPGSEVSVIQTGGIPTPVFDQPIFDGEAMIRRLKTLKGGYGASDMHQSLNAAFATLAGMTHARRELVVISDFQPSDWERRDIMAATIQQQFAAMNVKPVLSLLKVGENVTGNVSVESLNFAHRPLGVGEPLFVRANLKNHGPVAVDNVRVTLTVDGQEAGVSQVSLAANGQTQTLFTVAFETAGSHVMQVDAATSDSLETDNVSAAAVMILDQINVLLVDGDPSSQPLKGETDFLSVALTPYSFGRMKLSDLVKTTTVTADKLTAEVLADARVVVMANVPKLKDDRLSILQEFVSDGGSLLVCPGNRIDTRWYNDKLVTESRLLPAAFGTPKGIINDQGQSAHIVAQHFDHPALEFFNEPANGDLSTAEIRQWFELKTDSDLRSGFLEEKSQRYRTTQLSDVEPLPAVLARLDNGDPLLVEQTFGEGVVIQMATSCDADWSDLPMRPFFVPLMQQLVTTMATQFTPPGNIRTGEPAVAVFSTSSVEREGDQSPDDGSLPPADFDESGRSLSITTPDGARRSLMPTRQGRRMVARFEGTQQPGVYSMTALDGRSIHFVAGTSREESRPGMLDEEHMTTLAADTQASVVATADEYLEQDRLRRHGQDVWKYVLLAVLAFMFLELVMQQRFSRVRT